MTTRLALIAAAAAATLGTAPVHAQTDNSVQELRKEIEALRKEVESLKRGQAAAPAAAHADGPSWGDRIEQVELKQKDAVTAGDIGGSFRLPGSETSIHLYGYAEAHAIRDFKAWSGPDNFTNLMAQPQSTTGVSGRTKLTAETSRFGIETSTPTSHGPFNMKIETDFYAYDGQYGARNRLRLRHAYGEYAGFLVGQTWATFMDLDNPVETVDFNAQIGVPFSRRTMLRYNWGDAKGGYKFTFAAEDPTDQNGPGTSVNERVPTLVARYDQTFDWGGINVRTLTHEKRTPLGNSRRGYGLGFGANYKLTDTDLLTLTAARVDGDADNLLGSNAYTFSGDNSQIFFDRNYGFALGYNKTFGDSLRANLSYEENRSQMDAAARAAFGTSANHRLQQVHAGMIYTAMKNVELGGEYIWGRRATFGDGVSLMSRVDLMGRYSF